MGFKAADGSQMIVFTGIGENFRTQLKKINLTQDEQISFVYLFAEIYLSTRTLNYN